METFYSSKLCKSVQFQHYARIVEKIILSETHGMSPAIVPEDSRIDTLAGLLILKTKLEKKHSKHGFDRSTIGLHVEYLASLPLPIE